VLLQRLDFLSVGSNDLLQFLFASDRGNPRLSDRYDPLSPAVLTFFGELARRCNEANVPLTLCGEMGGRPIEAMALIGLGFRRLSMAASSIGPVKAMIRCVELAALQRYVDEIKRSADHSVREKLRAFAADHDIPL
jgi:phosphotransferase system, enzyme I, PtsP